MYGVPYEMEIDCPLSRRITRGNQNHMRNKYGILISIRATRELFYFIHRGQYKYDTNRLTKKRLTILSNYRALIKYYGPFHIYIISSYVVSYEYVYLLKTTVIKTHPNSTCTTHSYMYLTTIIIINKRY